MTSCEFDWELASKFIPLISSITTIFVAYLVYKIWHKQKEKEVIATEAKSIIMELFELNKIFSDLINLNFETKEEMIEKMRAFKAQRWYLMAKLSFLKNCLSNEKFKNWMRDFDNETIEINNLIKPFLEKNSKKDMLDFALLLEIKNNSKDERELHSFQTKQVFLLEACKDLAMYRKL
ncbi:TPA: hypothetical protein JI034_13985 [Acinetobacter baumannii]|uniref:hypothetical protein n=1 Tax=Acinetobacter baumannii TaxID=470 RepID=UPI0007E988B7|nr:hypothetical protein [Acinetobacter baumannii]MDC4403706.1 hypothetical protein [Acinetobacter baumannii]QTM21273.1 hypothetical protein J7D37_06320 [Acinetobacter baumannii]SBS22574.1 Uncharacterised protein [Acinetobacter baumannii]HAV5075560.1 hypothetical protein [Acinetobacter baumannii]HAV5094163.1 hypothetical protein [Acinetobacter baumannii]